MRVSFNCGLLFFLFVFSLHAAVVHAEIIKVGVLVPLSGVRADAGEYYRGALALAASEIDGNPHRRYKLKFVFEDTQYTPRQAVSAFYKLKNDLRVDYMIGPHGSSEALAVAPLVERSRTLLITPYAQNDEISQAGDYVFRTIHNSAQEAPFFADFLARKMRGDILHAIVVDTAISPSYLKNMRPTLEKFGKRIGLVETFTPDASDVRAQLTRIKGQNPADVFMLGTPINEGMILKEAAEIGLKVQFFGFGTEGAEMLKIAGHHADGLLYAYSYDCESPEPRVREFYERFVRLQGMPPDAGAVNAYDAAILFSDCFEKAGDNVEAVKNCLYQVKDYQGASGTFSIDANGDAIKQLIIKTIKNGRYVKYQGSEPALK